jgi:transposase
MEYTKEHGRFYAYTEWKRGRNSREIHEALGEVWSDAAPGYSTVARWTSDFTSERRNSFEDAPRVGRPVSASGDGPTAAVMEIVKADPRLSTRAISDQIGADHMTVWRILTTQLKMHRVASYWVPQLLTAQHKLNRVHSATRICQQLQSMGAQRYTQYVVEDETWVNFDIQHTSSTARQWVKQGMPRPTAVSSKLTPRKCLMIVAFSACKRFSIKAIPYGETVNGDVYIEFVRETGRKWLNVRRNPINLQNVIWQHDNARPHTKHEVVEFFQQRKISLLHQAPYSPDLNLCDRWLFSTVKKDLRLQQFSSCEEVEAAFLLKVQSINEADFRKHVDLLIMHCMKVVDCGGDYVVPSD